MSIPGMCSIVDVAGSETVLHLRYLRRSMLMDLLFTIIIVVVNMVNEMAAITSGATERFDGFYLLTPPPTLFIALSISAVVQFFLLRKLRASMREMSRYRADPRGADGEHAGKSITDVNYDIIGAMGRSLKIWPIIAFFFLLYFAMSAAMLAGWTLGLLTNATLNYATALNVITLFLAMVFFWLQTKHWLVQRRKLKELERMEKVVLDELRI
jgi:hypothetical protein